MIELSVNYRALQTMIDLGRITALCTDCPQVIPIAGDLTMDGMNRHIYRLAYQAAQSYGAKVTLKLYLVVECLIYFLIIRWNILNY